MNEEDSKVQNKHDGIDDVKLEDVELGNLAPERESGKDDSLDDQTRQKRAVRHVVKRQGASRDLEKESAGGRSGIIHGLKPLYMSSIYTWFPPTSNGPNVEIEIPPGNPDFDPSDLESWGSIIPIPIPIKIGK